MVSTVQILQYIVTKYFFSFFFSYIKFLLSFFFICMRKFLFSFFFFDMYAYIHWFKLYNLYMERQIDNVDLQPCNFY